MAGKSRFYQLSVVGLLLCFLLGCGFFALLSGDCGLEVTTRATFLDRDTGEPATDVIVGVRSFLDGQELEFIPPLIFDGTPSIGPPDSEGFLEPTLLFDLGPCPPTKLLGLPDRVEFIFVRNGCETSTTVDINEGTADFSVVDEPGTRRQVITLNEPVLVPRCEP